MRKTCLSFLEGSSSKGCRLAVWRPAGHVGHISAIDFALRERESASTPAGQQVAQGVVGRAGSRALINTHAKVTKRTLLNAINVRRKHLI